MKRIESVKGENMSIIKRLWWFFKLEKKRYLIGIIALSLVSVVNLIPPIAMGRIVDNIASRQLTSHELAWQLFLLIFSALAMYYLRFIWRQYILGTSFSLGKRLRAQLYMHFTKMSPSFYQKYRTGDLMAHATNDINALTQLAGGGVMSAVDASITALVTLLTMFFVLSPELTIVAVMPLPLMAICTNRIGKKMHASFKSSQAAFSDLNNHVQESVAGIRVTKSFGYQEAAVRAFDETNHTTYQKNMKTMFYNALFQPTTRLFVGASYALSLVIGGFLIQSQRFSVGELVTFITYLDMLVWPLTALGFLFNITQRGAVSYDRIEAILAETSEVVESDTPIECLENGQIHFAIEEFSYASEVVLSNIDITLEKGQILGIVGPTGAGKTTLLRLLLREQDCQAGSIFLNGHSIKDYRLSDLRQLMGYVMQEQLLFATSIKENIAFGNRHLSQEAIEQVAKDCSIYQDIMAMEYQFDTLVGERGVALSGGQKQRIALSRALVLDPDILLLDDSLSAVDAKTEHVIVEHLKERRQGKTTLITSHRLSTVMHADKIVVLDKGTVIEMGTHDTLLAQKGWYYTTYMAQKLEMELEDNHV